MNRRMIVFVTLQFCFLFVAKGQDSTFGRHLTGTSAFMLHNFGLNSFAFNYWPVYTNLPASFAERENKWHNYFFHEPGFNFGFKF